MLQIDSSVAKVVAEEFFFYLRFFRLTPLLLSLQSLSNTEEIVRKNSCLYLQNIKVISSRKVARLCRGFFIRIWNFIRIFYPQLILGGSDKVWDLSSRTKCMICAEFDVITLNVKWRCYTSESKCIKDYDKSDFLNLVREGCRKKNPYLLWSFAKPGAGGQPG